MGGHKQEYGVNFWETYSPVVNWFTIRVFLILTLIHGWKARQMDFVLAFPQADIETPMFMQIPKGFNVPNGKNEDYCLQLIKNVYGTRQGSRTWNRHIHNGLIKLGFTQSKMDECLYFRNKTILLLYVDDAIIIDPREDEIYKVQGELLDAGYDLTDEGTLDDYLGVHITRDEIAGQFHLTQPKLIESILKDMNFQENTSSVPFPAKISQVLDKAVDEPSHAADWNYRSIIGKLNYLEKSTRPDLAFATHNAARFSSDPRQSHTAAVTKICRYLVGTRDKGLIFEPSQDPELEVYADASFAGDWKRETATDDPATAHSRTGYVIMLADCPLIWASKLQTEIALSTTECEYVSLSEALRNVIPIMHILEECVEHDLLDTTFKPKIKCTAFEDNSGALVMAKSPRMRPRTKHMNIKWHHFRSYTEGADPRIQLQAIGTEDQLGDLFTKAVTFELFVKFRKAILGW